MSIELTNFNQRYEEAVSNIKMIKVCNQKLQQNTSLDTAQEGMKIENAKKKVQIWINDMQNQYLDPQTARRVQIVKQQLSNQLKKYELSKSNRRTQRHPSQQNPSDEQSQLSTNEYIDFQTQRSMQAQKTKDIKTLHSKLLNINKIAKETQKLTYDQGQKLDLVDQSIQTTLTNTRESNSYLQEAQKQQKKGQKKYICLIAIVGIIVALVLTTLFLVI